MAHRDARGTPKDLFARQVNKMVASMAYPEVIAYLHATRGTERAKADLKDIVKGIASQVMAVWIPKSGSLKKIIKKFSKLIGETKVTIKILERDSQQRPFMVHIINKDCVFCPEEGRGIVLPKELPFCISTGYALETVMQSLIERKFKFEFQYPPETTKVTAETISSKSIGDKHCVHLLYFKYEGE